MLHRSSTVSIKGTISARNGSDELTSNYISAILYFQKIHKARASRYRSCLLTEFIFDAVSLHADIHHATTNFHVRLLFLRFPAFSRLSCFSKHRHERRSIDRNGSILISLFFLPIIINVYRCYFLLASFISDFLNRESEMNILFLFKLYVRCTKKNI